MGTDFVGGRTYIVGLVRTLDKDKVVDGLALCI